MAGNRLIVGITGGAGTIFGASLPQALQTIEIESHRLC
jgi:hypothetical protein